MKTDASVRVIASSAVHVSAAAPASTSASPSPSSPSSSARPVPAVPSAVAAQGDAPARTMRPLDWALLMLPGLIWGASFLFIAEGLEVMAPMGVTFVRIAVGFATLSLAPQARRAMPREAWPGIVTLGIVWIAFPLSMFPFAEQHVSSALAGMLNGSTPLFAALVAGLLAHKAPPRLVVVGLVVGLTGAVLVALPSLGVGGQIVGGQAGGAADGDANGALGVALILAALCSYGVAINLARPLQQRYGALPVMWRALGVALLLTAPLGLPALPEAAWTLRATLCLLALGALGTGVAYVLLATASGRFGATAASSSTLLIPVVALALGLLIRHERVAVLSMIGAAVCLLGAWLITAKPASAPTMARETAAGARAPAE